MEDTKKNTLKKEFRKGIEKGNSTFKEFKKFISKGNVVDMAVGVIIGSAFGKIVTSLVENIFMPLIGIIIGKVDFSSLLILFTNLTSNFDSAPITLVKYLPLSFTFIATAWPYTNFIGIVPPYFSAKAL